MRLPQVFTNGLQASNTAYARGDKLVKNLSHQKPNNVTELKQRRKMEGSSIDDSQEAVLQQILSPKATGSKVRNKFSKSILDQIVNGRDDDDVNRASMLPVVSEATSSRLGAAAASQNDRKSKLQMKL